MRVFIFSLLILIFSGCTRTIENPVIGVKIYDHQGDLEELFGKFRSVGINTLFASPELAKKTGFMDLARKSAMPVFLIVPVFYNPAALERDTTLYAITSEGDKAVKEWVRFVCPNRKDYRRDHLEYMQSLVRELSPQGISIDFIRYFVFWEKVYPGIDLPQRDPDIQGGSDYGHKNLPETCFDGTCLDLFRQKYKISFPADISTIEERAHFILTRYPSEWTEFKMNTITDVVKEITGTLRELDPSLQFNLHMVPWREEDFDGAIRNIAGQDVEKLAPWVNYISPMCYSQMVRQTPEWVRDVVNHADVLAPDKVLPSIQVSRAYLEEPFSVEDFHKSLLLALESPSRGVIFWSWETLEKNREKQKVIRAVVKKLRP